MDKFKPNKIQSVGKRPTATVQSRVGTYRGSNNKGKAWPSIDVPMKNRMK